MRTVIFGVDGLTFRILRPLIERGDLPNFARLQREGVSAECLSTIPPLTPAAWMSIATGLKPAKHGVFDFWEFDTGSPKARSITHRKGGKAIWNILSEYGKRVIVMNVPLTYPAEAVNGIMVSGLMTPGASSPFTFPAAFRDELFQAVPNYCIDLSFQNIPLKQWYDEVMKMTEQRMRLQEYLLSGHEWDFAFLCYVGPDRLQHRLWGELMTFSHEATRYFRLLDDALGRVLNRLTAEDMLFVVSDHGFVGAKQWFYINEYLRRRQLLDAGSSPDQSQRLVIGPVREVARKLRLLGLARRTRKKYQERFDRRTADERREEFHQPFFNEVDWSAVRACVLSSSAFNGGSADIVFSSDITPADVEELKQAIEAERHPRTGAPLARAVYATKDLGDGPFLPPVEHLIVIPCAGTTFHLGTGRRNLWEMLDETKGIHEAEGVFFAWGAGIRQGVRVEPLQIYDLVPTLLHSLDIHAGEPFDGRVAREIFVEPQAGYERAAAESLVARKVRRLQARRI